MISYFLFSDSPSSLASKLTKSLAEPLCGRYDGLKYIVWDKQVQCRNYSQKKFCLVIWESPTVLLLWLEKLSKLDHGTIHMQMTATSKCSSFKKLFAAKGIRNKLSEKCLAVEVEKHWLKSDLEKEF